MSLRSDAPIPGANPVLALARCAVNTFKVSGRASRSEYWWAQATAGSVMAAAILTDSRQHKKKQEQARQVAQQAGLPEPTLAQPTFRQAPASLAASTLLTPGLLSLAVRRLHDTNRRGWWILLSPLDAIFALQGSRPEGTRFDRH